MTAIAWDGETLATDNMAVTGNTKFRATKLFVIEHHKKRSLHVRHVWER